MTVMKILISDIADTLFGSHCRLCGRRLPRGVSHVCHECWLSMPRAVLQPYISDHLTQQFATMRGFAGAASMFIYSHHSDVAVLIHDIKYHGCQSLGRAAGRRMAAELASSGIFAGVDALAPVPVHWRRRMARGYNQARRIALGISDFTGIPVVDALSASRSHTSQTRKTVAERMANLSGAFRADPGAVKPFSHIMLVDDVYTTGATVRSALETLSDAGVPRLSFVTLACASPL